MHSNFQTELTNIQSDSQTELKVHGFHNKYTNLDLFANTSSEITNELQLVIQSTVQCRYQIQTRGGQYKLNCCS